MHSCIYIYIYIMLYRGFRLGTCERGVKSSCSVTYNSYKNPQTHHQQGEIYTYTCALFEHSITRPTLHAKIAGFIHVVLTNDCSEIKRTQARVYISCSV